MLELRKYYIVIYNIYLANQILKCQGFLSQAG